MKEHGTNLSEDAGITCYLVTSDNAQAEAMAKIRGISHVTRIFVDGPGLPLEIRTLAMAGTIWIFDLGCTDFAGVPLKKIDYSTLNNISVDQIPLPLLSAVALKETVPDTIVMLLANAPSLPLVQECLSLGIDWVWDSSGTFQGMDAVISRLKVSGKLRRKQSEESPTPSSPIRVLAADNEARIIRELQVWLAPPEFELSFVRENDAAGERDISPDDCVREFLGRGPFDVVIMDMALTSADQARIDQQRPTLKDRTEAVALDEASMRGIEAIVKISELPNADSVAFLVYSWYCDADLLHAFGASLLQRLSPPRLVEKPSPRGMRFRVLKKEHADQSREIIRIIREMYNG